ncbi:MAG: hypothetical protein AAGC88_09825 [Bacteroidota bacterium]
MGLKSTWYIVLSIWICHITWANGTTDQFDIRVEVIDSNSAVVECTIAVAPDSGVTMLPIQAIKYENARISSVKVNNQEAELIDYNNFWKVEHYGFSSRSAKIAYEVQWQGEEAVIPVMYVPWKAADTQEGKMKANISLTEGLYIGNHFPDVALGLNSDGSYSFDLPVVTSLIKFDLRESDDFYISGTTVIDLVIIGLLIVLGVLGWQRRKMLI